MLVNNLGLNVSAAPVIAYIFVIKTFSVILKRFNCM